MKFDLRKPCDNCPFRVDCLEHWLGAARAREIAEAVAGSSHSTFSCHKTNEFGEDEEGFDIPVETEQSQHCGGAMLFLMNVGNPNMLMRLAFTFDKMKPADFTEENRQLVFDSVESFIEHHS